jgi:ribosome-binding factor A
MCADQRHRDYDRPKTADASEQQELSRTFRRGAYGAPIAEKSLSGILRGLPGGNAMAEPRSRVYHRSRVAETLREEIGAMLEGQLSDPRIAFCYVTEVTMQPGNKSARIYIAVDGDEEAEKATVAALTAAKGYIRHELLERMGVRRVPDLSFHIDKSQKFNARIDELLGRTRRRQRSASANDAPEAPAPPHDLAATDTNRH